MVHACMVLCPSCSGEKFDSGCYSTVTSEESPHKPLRVKPLTCKYKHNSFRTYHYGMRMEALKTHRKGKHRVSFAVCCHICSRGVHSLCLFFFSPSTSRRLFRPDRSTSSTQIKATVSSQTPTDAVCFPGKQQENSVPILVCGGRNV